MSRILVLIFFIALTVPSKAQTVEQDSSSFDATMDWLERKLTYNYFDPTNQQWWVNVIQKKENGAYTIKSIAAKHPKQVTEKIYHQRTFNMWDLNPRTVAVSDVPKDLGRFVKGKLVRLEGFKGENKIATKKDGRVGSKVSYIHISIPAFLEDSLQGYSLEIKEKLSNALYLDARIFNSNNLEENVQNTFRTLNGTYISEDSTTYLDFEVMDKTLVRFTSRKEKAIETGTIGYDDSEDLIYYFVATLDSYAIRRFKYDESARNLILHEDGGDGINVIGRNTFEFTIDGKSKRFFRY